MPHVDVLFTVVGTRVPTDHGYALYAAVCRLFPDLHDPTLPLALEPITGQYVGGGEVALDPARSRLRVRVPADALPRVLRLAGKSLTVAGRRLQLGAPRVFALQPSPSLGARMVNIKNATEAGAFLDAARRQLGALGIGGRLEVPVGARRGELRRLVLRIKGARLVCFPLLVHDLQPEESLRLQEAGLGGRRRLGCGVFIPAPGREGADAG